VLSCFLINSEFIIKRDNCRLRLFGFFTYRNLPYLDVGIAVLIKVINARALS